MLPAVNVRGSIFWLFSGVHLYSARSKYQKNQRTRKVEKLIRNIKKDMKVSTTIILVVELQIKF